MIETERLVLRLPAEGDVSAIAEQIGDAEVMRFIGDGATGTLADAVAQLDAMRRAWDDDGFGRFIVARKADGAILGRVGLLVWDASVWRPGTRAEIGADAEVELGWTLSRSAWGAGYATEAALAVRDWAFGELGLPRLISLIHPGNDRSMRVAARLGEQPGETITTWRGVAACVWSFPERRGSA